MMRTLSSSAAKKAVSAGLCFTLVFGSFGTFALADTQSDLDAASARLASLGAELNELQSSLDTEVAQLEETDNLIGLKEGEIAETQQELDEAKTLLGGRVRSSYKAGSTSLLDILLGADSFDDFISRVYYLDKITTQDAEQIASVKELEQELQTQKATLEEQQNEQLSRVDSITSQVSAYNDKLAEAQSWYDSLDAQLQEELAAQAAAEAAAAAEAERAAAATSASAALEAITENSPSNSVSSSEQEATSSPNAASSSTGTASNESSSSSSSSNSSSSSSGSSGASSASSGGGLSTAYDMIGVPYVWGGTSASGVDCSGLVVYCYGWKRGRTTYSMIDSLKSSGDWKTSMSELSVGDLVFPHSGHVGIYIGNGQMIHAPYPGRSVCIQSVYGFIGGGSY